MKVLQNFAEIVGLYAGFDMEFSGMIISHLFGDGGCVGDIAILAQADRVQSRLAGLTMFAQLKQAPFPTRASAETEVGSAPDLI